MTPERGPLHRSIETVETVDFVADGLMSMASADDEVLSVEARRQFARDLASLLKQL
jgi:hypothetical protein